MTTHRLSLRDLVKIEKITSAREQAALAKLSQAAARRQAAAKAIAEIRAVQYEAGSVEEAELIANWFVWQQKELAERNMKLAAAEAAYHQAVRECGRQVAEHAVLTNLLARAKKSEARDRESRAAETTFPVGQSR